MLKEIVVVGASLAGIRSCQNLRRNGFEGTLTLIGEEKYLPYDRPPLSKSMLTTDQNPQELFLVSEAEVRDLEINLLLDERATGLNTLKQEVTVGEQKIHYEGLVIATGASARKLSKFTELDGIHTLRTLDDALAIRSGLTSGSSIVIVGAGFIGSEIASAARTRGCKVTIIEGGAAPLIRGLGEKTGMACGSLHQRHGVELLLSTQVASIHGSGAVEEIELSDGTQIPASMLVVGIGASPNTEWLSDSGLTIDNGVLCDETLNVGVPGIYAAGDVARAPNRWSSLPPARTEHWSTATEHAALAAKNLLAPSESTPYHSVPFVWSDQYQDRIQIAGDTSGSTHVTELIGSFEEDAFVVGYQSGASISGIASLNSMREFAKFRRLLMTGGSWSDALDLAKELTS